MAPCFGVRTVGGEKIKDALKQPNGGIITIIEMKVECKSAHVLAKYHIRWIEKPDALAVSPNC